MYTVLASLRIKELCQINDKLLDYIVTYDEELWYEETQNADETLQHISVLLSMHYDIM